MTEKELQNCYNRAQTGRVLMNRLKAVEEQSKKLNELLSFITELKSCHFTIEEAHRRLGTFRLEYYVKDDYSSESIHFDYMSPHVLESFIHNYKEEVNAQLAKMRKEVEDF